MTLILFIQAQLQNNVKKFSLHSRKASPLRQENLSKRECPNSLTAQMPKKQTCPLCNGKNIAKILWGFPANMGALEEELDSKKNRLGRM